MLTVGQFARATRLSAKQLRSYDALGLLPPAQVDPQTGYRYYHPRQARTAVTIALLRSLDVPLAAIRDLLVADEQEAERLLDAERERLAAELAARERTLRALRRLRTAHELMPFAVETAVEPSRRLLALRATTTDERMHDDAVALIARLLELLPWAAEPDAAPIVGLYPLDLDGELPFAVGVEATDARVAVPPPLTIVELPGGPVARVLHSGSHEELALAYFPLLAWLQERGHAAAGPVRECYLDDPARVDPERLRTEVSIPLDDHHDHEETIR